MKTSLSIANSSQETGALLKEYLQKRMVYDTKGEAVVCYGSPRHSKYVLNGNCGTDKITRLKIMNLHHVTTVPWFNGMGDIPKGMTFPMLARKASGYGGTDIVPVFQKQEIPWRLKAGWDWFSSYIPVAREFRVWIFHSHTLDTYEKIMVRPKDYAFIGRNFRNGFDFSLTKSKNKTSWEALKALEALKLDFGAVDMLEGEDGKIYVLEVNTAPGVIRSGAQPTLGKLADRIVEWVEGL